MQPNSFNQVPALGNAIKSENRAMQTRRDNDLVKSYAITLETIDSTIMKHMSDVINPTIVESNKVVKVPVQYASPERWKAIRIDGYMRDQNGKIQRPLIVFSRTGFSANEQLASFNRELYYPVIKRFSNKNRFNQYNILTGKYQKEPVQEIYNIVMPDHRIITYEFIVWTDKVAQMNDIIQKIDFAVNDYWGDKMSYRFRVDASEYSNEESVSADSDRIIKTTFTLTVYAYLRPDFFEDGRPAIQKVLTPRKVTFGVEFSEGTKIENRDDSIFVDPNKNSRYKSLPTK